MHFIRYSGDFRLTMQQNVFSIDVEDWFHILDAEKVPQYSDWDFQSSVVEKNFGRLLDLLDRKNVRATCFFLGWIARKYPHLVKDAAQRGHEVASHGFKHTLIFEQSPDEFGNDISDAKKLLEDLSGKRVVGYRAPGFSIMQDNAWALDVIHSAGYDYDSSLFPARREHGGFAAAETTPHIIATGGGDLYEFPITIDSTAGKDMCYFGGGYLRLFPYGLIRNRANKIIRQNRPVFFYVHPRDIDPGQPRIDLGFYRNFKCYVNLKTAYRKIERILSDFSFITFAEMVHQYEWKRNSKIS